MVKLKSFAENFFQYTHYLQKILPYQLKRSVPCVSEGYRDGLEATVLTAFISSPFSLEEECEAPLCTAALTTKNQELQSDMKKVTSIFEKLQNYINLLALPSGLTVNI